MVLPSDKFYILTDLEKSDNKKFRIISNNIMKNNGIFTRSDILNYLGEPSIYIKDNIIGTGTYITFLLGPFDSVSHCKFLINNTKLKELDKWYTDRVESFELYGLSEQATIGEEYFKEVFITKRGNRKKLQMWIDNFGIKNPQYFI